MIGFYMTATLELNGLKIQWKFSAISKTSKKVYDEVVFFDMQKYVYSESVNYRDKTQMLKELPSD